MNPDIQSLPLRDIHLPESVSWWPPALGWWLLVVLIFSVIAAVMAYKKYKRKRRLKREALSSLQAIKYEYYRANDPLKTIQSLSKLLRQIAITYHSRHQVAALTGPEWIQFLNSMFETSKQHQAHSFTHEMGVALTTAHYSYTAHAYSESFIEDLINTTAALIEALPLLPKSSNSPHPTQQLVQE